MEEDVEHVGPPLVRCEDLLHVRDIANKTWNSHRISPLHGFLPDEEDVMEEYSASLSRHISVECVPPKGQRFISSIYPLESYDEVQGDEETSYAIVVGLENEIDGSFDHFCLLAILCGIGSSKIREQAHMKEEGFAFFPILLTKGLKIVSVGVGDWLQKKFDCRISVLKFTPCSLAKMACVWAVALERDKATAQAFELKYTFPPYITGMKVLTLTIPASSMSSLYDAFKDSSGNELLEGLEKHFFNHFRITLSSLMLTRVGTAMAYVSSEGRIKLSSAAPYDGLLLLASFAMP